MTKTENLLTILAEECVETAQRATKAIRFTLDEVQPNLEQNPKELTNAERIVYEFNDIVAIMEILQEEGLIHTVIDREAIDKKKIKIAKYTKYSQEVGAISE